MRKVLTCTVAVMLLAGMTAAVLAEETNPGVAKAIPAVVTNVTHTSLTLSHKPRIDQISSQPTGRPAVILPGASAPLSVDNVPGETRGQSVYNY